MTTLHTPASHRLVMVTRLAVILFCLAASSVVATRAAGIKVLGEPPAPSAVEAIRALEDECRRAVMHLDFPALERIWSERLVVNNPANSVAAGRAAVFELFRRRAEGGRLYSVYDQAIECITFDGDLAIVMGAEAVAPPGAPVGSRPMARRFTNIWRLRDGAWQLIARQASMLAPGALPVAPPTPGS